MEKLDASKEDALKQYAEADDVGKQFVDTYRDYMVITN